MSIVLYDLYSVCPEVALSTSTWKTRYCLNLKGLPHKTEWLEFQDLEPLYKKIGLAAPTTNDDGTPRYSVPLIYDPATRKHVADSLAIADYLDETYPGRAIFPQHTRALQPLLEPAYFSHIWPLFSFVTPAVCAALSPMSDAYYQPKRLAFFGKPPVAGPARERQWALYRDGLGRVDAWYAKEEGPFLMGTTVSWGDLVVASCIVWLRVIYGRESGEWKDIMGWHGGRWARLMDALRDFERVM